MTDTLPRIASGDSLALRECIRRYLPVVRAIARGFRTSDADVEDAVQDVFVDLWRAAPRFDATRGSEIGFVRMLAYQRLVDRWRRTRHARPSVPSAWSRLDRASERIEARSEAALIVRMMAELPREQREVIVLSAWHGMSYAEIADTLCVPLGTVKSRARLAMARLRRRRDEATMS